MPDQRYPLEILGAGIHTYATVLTPSRNREHRNFNTKASLQLSLRKRESCGCDTEQPRQVGYLYRYLGRLQHEANISIIGTNKNGNLHARRKPRGSHANRHQLGLNTVSLSPSVQYQEILGSYITQNKIVFPIPISALFQTSYWVPYVEGMYTRTVHTSGMQR